MDFGNENDRNIIFCEEIEEESTKNLIKNIVDINMYDSIQESTIVDYQRIPIRIYMTTAGGSLHHTIALFDIIKHSKTPVWIFVSGYCCSGGFYMLGAADKVFAYEHTEFMYHQLSYKTPFSTLEQQQQNVDLHKKLQEVADNLILENTNISKEKLAEINKKQIDWWMDAKEAKKLGVIDEIIR